MNMYQCIGMVNYFNQDAPSGCTATNCLLLDMCERFQYKQMSRVCFDLFKNYNYAVESIYM